MGVGVGVVAVIVVVDHARGRLDYNRWPFVVCAREVPCPPCVLLAAW